jgi:hypothetical protein
MLEAEGSRNPSAAVAEKSSLPTGTMGYEVIAHKCSVPSENEGSHEMATMCASRRNA